MGVAYGALWNGASTWGNGVAGKAQALRLQTQYIASPEGPLTG